MKRSRLVLASLLSAVALSLAADPVAAQSSVSAELINQLNNKLMLIAVPITLLVEGILIYTVYRFKDADEAKSTQENRRLEITWTVATAIILLFVGVASYGVLANENVSFQQGEQAVAPDSNDVLVHMDAFQWGWQASYPKENVSVSSTAPTVVVPVGQDVYFNITSSDVLHAFHVPQMGLKQDAMPGQSNVIKTVPLEEGTYQGYCAEFCGVAHSQMYFEIEVVSQSEYQQYIEEQKSGSSSDLEPDEEVVRAHDDSLERAPVLA
ncbi:cytochrome c oxidase subunit II [Haloplanus halophilus]|uniref:cytochrome c oxidase subunit II n=1 Tax=Haloplanus halophilus TaxID=2949993 RepID=UPI00203A7439|nr:cytochrome c oxidase subunit II [Haloplanus sp. GDY1]